MRPGWNRRVVAELHKNVSDDNALKRILENMRWAHVYKHVYYKSNARF